MTSRIPKYTRGKAYDWYAKMFDIGLMYHPDDAPEDIVHPNCTYPSEPFIPLFTAEECAELNAIYRFIKVDTHGDPCGCAYRVMVDKGQISEN